MERVKCVACPAAGACLGQTSHAVFCEWAAGGDDVFRTHIVNRSALPKNPEPAAPARPHPRRTMMHVRVELVNTCATYCRQCAAGCQISKCLVGRGDEFGNAPLMHCVACILAKDRPRPVLPESG